jgi:hypothetical protein
MRYIRIYLHTNTTRLQSLVHVLAATCFFLKASHLQLNGSYFLHWFYFYISLGVLLAVAALFQAVNKFAFRYLAANLNILAGIVLIVGILVKFTLAEKLVPFKEESIVFYLLNFTAGLFFMLMGIFENQIRRIPYMAFNQNKIYGRKSWFSTFTFTWNDIETIDFRHRRVKITTPAGQVLRFRVARQGTGGFRYKAAEYFCQEVLQARSQNQAPSAAS